MGFFEVIFGDGRWLYLWHGLEITLVLTVYSLIIGVIIGVIIALLRVSPIKIFNFIAKIYVDIIRGTPLLVQLLIMYYVVFGSYQFMPKLLVAAIAFGINSGAYIAEIIRGGIESIDSGQMEAARSLGLNYSQAMRLVILPQAFKNSLPALISEFIALLKETIKEKERETRKQKQTISRKEKSIKELKIFNEKLQKELIVYSSTSMDQKDRTHIVYNKTLYTQNVFYEKQYHFRDDLEFGEW